MNVESIAFDRYWALGRGDSIRPHAVESGDEVREKSPSLAEETESPVVETPDPTQDDADEARGVIRLLEAGHFKGVADIRLRINFAEELAGAELPELSAPKGNGKAYEKFLQIYRDMQGTDEVETPDDTQTPVDSGTPDEAVSVDMTA
jgi:hypothetical protein